MNKKRKRLATATLAAGAAWLALQPGTAAPKAAPASAGGAVIAMFTKRLGWETVNGPTETMHESDGNGLGVGDANKLPASVFGDIWIYNTGTIAPTGLPGAYVTAPAAFDVYFKVYSPSTAFNQATVTDGPVIAVGDDLTIYDGAGNIVTYIAATSEWMVSIPSGAGPNHSNVRLHLESPNELTLGTECDALPNQPFESAQFAVTRVEEVGSSNHDPVARGWHPWRVLVEDLPHATNGCP